MAITISGENNNDRITAQDGVIDTISGFNIAGIITASSFTGDLTGDVTGNITGNVTGNINNSTLLLQTGGTERLRITSAGRIGINQSNPLSHLSVDYTITGSESEDGLRLKDNTNSTVTALQTTSTSYNYAGVAGHHSMLYSAKNLAIVADGQNSGSIKLMTGNSERLRITSDGFIQYAPSNMQIFADTSDGSDDHYLNLSGGGACAQTRGAQVVMYGNEKSNEQGRLLLMAGNSGNTNGSIDFYSGGSKKATITSAGDMGLGTNSPENYGGGYVTLEVAGSTNDNGGVFKSATSGSAGSGSSGIEMLMNTDPVGGSLNVVTAHPLKFATANTERARIDSSGRLLVGTSTVRTNLKNHNGNATTPKFQFETANVDNANDLSLIFGRNNSFASEIIFGKHRTATVNGNTIVQNGDRLGGITFSGSDGTNFIPAAYIQGSVGGTPGTNDMPGRLQFFTTADGASTPSERLTIQSNGNIEIGTATDAGNTLRYFDIVNYNTGNSAGVVQRLLTRKSDGTSAAGLDIVKYKAGGASLINYETIGSNGYISFSTGENAGSPIERLRIHGSGAVTKPYQYVFTVSTSGTSKSTGWTKITGLAPYTSQCTGVSDGTYWSNTNQQFTAPVTGVYYFFVGGWASPNNNGQRYAYSFKHQNGNNLTFIGGGDYCTTDSPMAGWSRTIKLSAGEWVELWAYSAINATWGNNPHHFFWGGYLLG